MTACNNLNAVCVALWLFVRVNGKKLPLELWGFDLFSQTRKIKLSSSRSDRMSSVTLALIGKLYQIPVDLSDIKQTWDLWECLVFDILHAAIMKNCRRKQSPHVPREGRRANWTQNSFSHPRPRCEATVLTSCDTVQPEDKVMEKSIVLQFILQRMSGAHVK